MPSGRLSNKDYQENLAAVARVRRLIKEGLQSSAIAKQVHRSKDFVNSIKNKGYFRDLSTPLNSLQLRKPANPDARCRRCDTPGRIFTKSNLCLVCEVLELGKFGLVTIKEPGDSEDDDDLPNLPSSRQSDSR